MYLLFVAAVDEGWRGPIGEKAKAHAARIAAVLARRLVGLEWEPPHRPVLSHEGDVVLPVNQGGAGIINCSGS